MDFGLGKYLEMFEARFGKSATTALILFITIVLFSVGLGLIWSNLIEPIYEFLKAIQNSEEWLPTIKTLVGSVFLGIIILTIYMKVFWKKSFDEQNRRMKEIKLSHIEIINGIKANKERLEEKNSELEELRKMLER